MPEILTIPVATVFTSMRNALTEPVFSWTLPDQDEELVPQLEQDPPPRMLMRLLMTTGVPELNEWVPPAIKMVSPSLALAMRPDIPVGEQELFTPFVPQVYVAARAMLADPRARHTLPKVRHHLIHEIYFIVLTPIF